MANIVTRLGKGSALTWEEGDANIVNLNDAKIESENTGAEGQVLTKTETGAEWADAGGFGFTGSIGFTGSQGDIGFTGSQGETGFTGSQGDIGFTGSQGAAGVDALWNFTGTYNGGASYAVGDVATYNGETWYRINSNGGNVGDTPVEGSFWTLIAEKGANGSQGETGFTGSQGDIGFTGSQGEGGLAAVVDDTAPQLGGDLDVNGYNLIGNQIALRSSDETNTPARTIVKSAINIDDPEATFAVVDLSAGPSPWQDIRLKSATYNSSQEEIAPGFISLEGNILLNDLTYPSADGTSGQFLTTDGAGVLSWGDAANGGIIALVEDTAPQLGGNLDTNGYAIEGYTTTITGSNSIVLQGGAADSIALGGGSVSIKANGDTTKIVLTNDGTFGNIGLTSNGVISINTTDMVDINGAQVKINNLYYPFADGTAGQFLTTDGFGLLSWGNGGIAAVVNDTAPMLGGDLNVDDNSIFGIKVELEAESLDNTYGMARARVRTLFVYNDPEATYAETTISSRDGQIITVKGSSYDSTDTIVADGSISIVGNVSINSLAYPSVDGTAGQILSTDGAGVLSWNNLTLNDIVDVTITDPVANDVFLYTGSEWINSPVLGDINAALIAINGV